MTHNLTFGFDNTYTQQYYEFLESRDILEKTDVGENHHIYPKSIFGNNKIIIRLTYQDHFKAHWFLVKIYEHQDMKREYMQMAKAFFRFVNVKEYRKEIIQNYNDDEISALAELVAEAKEQNRLTSIGELNPMYGVSHPPEILEKMRLTRLSKPFKWSEEQRIKYKEFCKNRHPDDIPRHWYYNPETLISYRYNTNDIKNGIVPSNYIVGKYTSPEESLRRSLSMREVSSINTIHYWKSGEDSHVYNTKHIF